MINQHHNEDKLTIELPLRQALRVYGRLLAVFFAIVASNYALFALVILLITQPRLWLIVGLALFFGFIIYRETKIPHGRTGTGNTGADEPIRQQEPRIFRSYEFSVAFAVAIAAIAVVLTAGFGWMMQQTLGVSESVHTIEASPPPSAVIAGESGNMRLYGGSIPLDQFRRVEGTVVVNKYSIVIGNIKINGQQVYDDSGNTLHITVFYDDAVITVPEGEEALVSGQVDEDDANAETERVTRKLTEQPMASMPPRIELRHWPDDFPQ